MRKSKILKGLSYVLIPILLLIIIISMFYELYKENFAEENVDNSEYFQSDEFLSNYMHTLSNQVRNIIYKNDRYKSITDGDYKICYEDDNLSYTGLKDFYFIIVYDKYNNLVLTNVELTTETNTVEKIQNFIVNAQGKKASIVDGIVEANSEIVSNKAIQYFEYFNNTYYTITEGNEVINIIDASKDTYNDEYYSKEIIEDTELQIPNLSRVKKYHTTKIEDFKIYTTYTEEFIDRKDDMFYKKLISKLKPYENQMLYTIPVASICLVISFIYLIIAIGHTKEKEEIDLNDFDKIPIEVILGFAFIIVCSILAITFESLSYVTEQYYNFAISSFITVYFLIYIICAVSLITVIKRIKAKTLIKDSITGKICKWIFNIVKRVLRKFKNSYKKITEFWPITFKLIIIIVGYIIISIILISVMQGFGASLSLILAAYILYKFIERINCYKKIEEHLKKMYEGDHSEKLNSSDFTPEFQNIVKYINDVSSGFENAIQQGIKSERLKTELITNVSHDLKTPLTSIINYVDLLKKEKVENTKANEYIDILDNKSQRLKKLTEDLVEASKASSGTVKLHIEKINIGELIRQTTGEFEDKFKKNGLNIIFSIPNEEIYINADNKYMYRIIENLFSNISKYALENSRVYIDVRKQKTENKVKIDIKNISKERLNISAEELIQRFVRGDKSRTTEGSGLGISISKSLTEIQNGKFDLQIDGDLFKVELEFNVI